MIVRSRCQQNLARPLILSIDTRATNDLVAMKRGRIVAIFLNSLLYCSRNERWVTGMSEQRIVLSKVIAPFDRLCGLVIRVSGYRYRGLGFDSRRYQIF